MGEVWLLADFDGTLVDSYTFLPRLLVSILGEEKGKSAFRVLMDMDARRKYDIRRALGVAYPGLDGGNLGRLVKQFYLGRTMGATPIRGSLEAIRSLKKVGVRFGILCEGDDIPGMKLWRIMQSPFYRLADEIAIIGETVQDRLAYLKRKGLVIILNDKVYPLEEVLGIPNVVPVRILPPRSVRNLDSWRGEFSPTLRNWDEVRAFVLNFIESSYARKRRISY